MNTNTLFFLNRIAFSGVSIPARRLRGDLRTLFGLVLLLGSISTGVAKADLITLNIDFMAHSFETGSGGLPAPVDPVMGNFDITFDTDVAVTNQTAGITLNSLNIALGSPISYSYDPNPGGTQPGVLRVGGLNAGSNVIIFNPSTDDFWLFINDIAGTPTFEQLGYTQTSVSSNNLFYTLNQTGSVTVTAVPEPSGFALLLLGMPLVLRRCRRRT